MALLISLETSTTVCSAALHEDGKLLAFTELHVAQSASSKLTVMIDNLLGLAEIAPSQLGGVAVSAGPGSYTGLRIGVATAKGLCYALGIPLLSVNTLELMVHQVMASEVEEGLLCPMLDARRMEVYCLLSDGDGVVLESTSAKVVDEMSFVPWLDRQVISFFGNGAEKCRAVIHHPNARFLPLVTPSASALGALAQREFLAGRFQDIATYEPFYLKDFVAKKPKVV